VGLDGCCIFTKDFCQCSIYEVNRDNSVTVTVCDAIGLFVLHPEDGADMSLLHNDTNLLVDMVLQSGYLALFRLQKEQTRKYCAGD
jgi:hypothetical protein